AAGEWATVKLRYKWPKAVESQLMTQTVDTAPVAFDGCSADFRFSSAVAAWGMILRDSPHQGDASIRGVRSIVENALGSDPGGLRTQFIEMLEATEESRKTTET